MYDCSLSSDNVFSVRSASHSRREPLPRTSTATGCQCNIPNYPNHRRRCHWPSSPPGSFSIEVIMLQSLSHAGLLSLTSSDSHLKSPARRGNIPPAVCGQHTDAISFSNSKRWRMVAYKIWDKIASDPNRAAISGVQMKSSNFFFPCPLEEDSKQLLKMREIEKSGIRGLIGRPFSSRNKALIPDTERWTPTST